MSCIVPYYILLSFISTECNKDWAQVCLGAEAKTPNDMVNPSLWTNGKSSFANMHHSGVINVSVKEKIVHTERHWLQLSEPVSGFHNFLSKIISKYDYSRIKELENERQLSEVWKECSDRAEPVLKEASTRKEKVEHEQRQRQYVVKPIYSPVLAALFICSLKTTEPQEHCWEVNKN